MEHTLQQGQVDKEDPNLFRWNCSCGWKPEWYTCNREGVEPAFNYHVIHAANLEYYTYRPVGLPKPKPDTFVDHRKKR